MTLTLPSLSHESSDSANLLRTFPANLASSRSYCEDTMEPTTYEVPAENMGSLRAKIEKLARRAAKLAKKGADMAGYEPVGLLVVEEKVVDTGRDPHTDQVVKRLVYVVSVTGTTPRVAGWEFIATLQHVDGGTILRSVPTAEVGDSELAPYRASAPACDHCRQNRRRNDTFVVRHVETGDLRQVGRNCLADFTGAQSPEAYASLAELLCAVSDAVEGAGDFGSRGERAADLDVYLSYVVACIRVGGWFSRTAVRNMVPPKSATADDALSVMFPPPAESEAHRKFRVERTPTEEDAAGAARALAWTDEHLHGNGADLNDYEHNLSVAVQGGIVTNRLAGFAASLVRYYEQKVGVERTKAKQRTESRHVGSVGERLDLGVLTVQAVHDCDGNWGATHIHRFVDADGNVFTWFSSSKRLEVGSTYRVKGTVKKHDDYEGVKQTVIARCAAEPVSS